MLCYVKGMKPIDQWLLEGLTQRLSWLKEAPKQVLVYPHQPALLAAIHHQWPEVHCLAFNEEQTEQVDGVIIATIWVAAIDLSDLMIKLTDQVKPGGWLHWLALGDPSFVGCDQKGVWPSPQTFCELLTNQGWKDVVLSRQEQRIHYDDPKGFYRDLDALHANHLPVIDDTSLTLTLCWLHAWQEDYCVSIPLSSLSLPKKKPVEKT